MKVLGSRIYLDMPEIKEHKVSISPALNTELEKEEAAKFDRLKVFAVGEGNTETVVKQVIKPGDYVLVDPIGLKKSFIIEIDGSKKIVLSLYDILHIWD